MPSLLQVIYAWARDAPKLELPEGVGFKVGGKSPIQYLVLQVHYATDKPFRGKYSSAVCHETRPLTECPVFNIEIWETLQIINKF